MTGEVSFSRPEANAGIALIKPYMVTAPAASFPPAKVVLDSNENAFGPSPRAEAAAVEAARRLARYLENPARFLVPHLAKAHDLDPARMAIGFGSDDILARIARAYLRAGSALLRSRNSYLKVPNYAYANDAFSLAAPDRNFCTDVDAMLASLTADTRLVYLANPDNPSGAMISGVELRRLHAGLPEHVLLVVDCAYAEYVDDPAYETGERLVEDHENVVITRTFSKIYGLAGARVGWAYGPPHVIDTIARIGLTFPLATPSLWAAVAALEDRPHRQYVFTETTALRSEVTEALGRAGIHVYPGHGNFILIEMKARPGLAADLNMRLRREGILMRRFTAPEFDDCVRLTIGRREETRAAVAALIRLHGELA